MVRAVTHQRFLSTRPLEEKSSCDLRLHVPGDELGHLEHGHLLLAAEHRLQRIVGIDHGPLLGVLQLVLLDVVPERLCQGAAGQRLGADDNGQDGIGLHRLHQGGIGFALGGFLGSGLLRGRLLGSGFFGSRHGAMRLGMEVKVNNQLIRMQLTHAHGFD